MESVVYTHVHVVIVRVISFTIATVSEKVQCLADSLLWPE